MEPGTTVLDVAADAAGTASARTRDAGNTRSLLLHAARRRFALDGYSATTVREIAADAGVNVALINRYFISKEGLFEACLRSAVEGLERLDPGDVPIETLIRDIVSQLAGSLTSENSLQLLLLLRSSGDDRAERIRRDTFRYFAERMAGAAGWRDGDAGSESLMLRAQIAMAATFGMVLLRATSGLEPLTSATEDDLLEPLGGVLAALLAP
ncbi:hypothetical protein GCM10027406_08910 [Leifsonia lichenia]